MTYISKMENEMNINLAIMDRESIYPKQNVWLDNSKIYRVY